MIEHVVSHVKRTQEDFSYRVYVTDALRIISENTAKFVREGSYIGKRYVDIINPKLEDTRTGDEVIEHMKNKLRGGERK